MRLVVLATLTVVALLLGKVLEVALH